MRREHRIALFARRFRLLARREEFLRADPEERVAATRRSRRAIPLSLHDQVQVIGSGELDRVCAGAVRRLSAGGQGIAALLDALGHMEPDRLCGVYFALPKSKRRALRQDPVWDYNVRKVERGMDEAIADIDEIATDSEAFAKRRAELVAEMTAEDQATWERFEDEQMRRLAGLDHDLSDGEVETVEQAQSANAQILTKDQPSSTNGAALVAPTVITEVAQSSEIVQKEVFGPVVTVQKFSDDAEALRMANDVRYGLASSIWTEDVSRALEVSRRLEFGAVWVNTHVTIVSEMPHGGVKESGYGSDLSLASIEDYTHLKHVMVDISRAAAGS